MIKNLLFPFIFLSVFVGCEDGPLGLRIQFDQIYGLENGDRVIFEANHVGQVTDVAYSQEGHYVVDVVISEDFKNAASENSKFLIALDPQNEGKKAVQIVQEPRGGAVLAEGSIVKGSEPRLEDFDQARDEFARGLEGLKKQFEQFSDELRKIPESEEFKRLKAELDRLSEDMKKKGQQARETLEKDVLPRLQREMEKLRERLRELGRKEEQEPVETKVEDTRPI
jgi:hypothetical protein